MARFRCVDELEDNEENVFQTARQTLIRISSNILKNPAELKFRSLKVSFFVCQREKQIERVSVRIDKVWAIGQIGDIAQW